MAPQGGGACVGRGAHCPACLSWQNFPLKSSSWKSSPRAVQGLISLCCSRGRQRAERCLGQTVRSLSGIQSASVRPSALALEVNVKFTFCQRSEGEGGVSPLCAGWKARSGLASLSKYILCTELR